MIVNNVNSSAKYYSTPISATRYTNAAGYVRGVQRSDAFTPSGEAQSFSKLLGKLKNESDIRADRVNELQQQISSGQYFVPAQDIAARLLTNRY